jgi:hypothetical protein
MSNIGPTQIVARERLTGLQEQSTLSILKNILHCTIKNIIELKFIHKLKTKVVTLSSPFLRDPIHSSMVVF